MSAKALVVVAALAAAGPAAALPAFQQVRDAHARSDAVLLDRDGAPLHELRVDLQGRRLEWVPLAGISPALIAAVVQAEDRRFRDHAGVDWLALARAAAGYLLGQTPRGASTITMQLAAQLDASLRARARSRSWRQKWRQIFAARELERTWSKARILEAYLNLATFRGELQGIAAAARGLFGKDASGVDAQEAALLAALLREPGARAEIVARRACRLAAVDDCQALAVRAQQALGRPYVITAGRALAPFVARRLLKPGMTRVASTLDGALQRFALDALQRQLGLLEDSNVSDGAVLVADNETGEVLAYVGNAGASSGARYVDGVMAPRQAGSALKPFLYQLAIEQRLLTAATLIADTPVNLVTPTGLYVPQNYDRDFRGLVSVRTALSGSLNVPAVRALIATGTEAFTARLRALGFEDITREGDHYGYALALGAPEVRLWQLVNAYRTLANGGAAGELALARAAQPAPRVQVMDAAATHIVADILADRAARSVSFGLASPLATRYWSAVKTGTSKDMRDNWCVGFSARYTVGVWIGNFSGAAMWNVSGVSGAAPLWLEIMNWLHRDGADHAPARPAGIVETRIEYERGVEPARTELFLAGSEEARIALAAAATARPRIAYPGNGSILALDPDIPVARQRVRFAAAGISGPVTWRLNGHAVGGGNARLWQPLPGRHALSLADAEGRELDRIVFEVRGRPQPQRVALPGDL